MKRSIQAILFLFCVFSSINAFAQISAGERQDICAEETILDATPSSGYWKLMSGNGIIVSSAAYNSSVKKIGRGKNVFRWHFQESGTWKSSDVAIYNNLPTQASVIYDKKEICEPEWTLIASTAQVGTGQWSVVSGRGIIENTASPYTAVTEIEEGTSIFRWTTRHLNCSTFADLKLINNDVHAKATEITETCGPETNLAAEIPVRGTGFWKRISGEGIPGNSTQARSVVKGLATGANVFRWTVRLGICSDYVDTWVVNNLQDATASADRSTVCDGAVALTAKIPPGGFESKWEVIEGEGIFDDSSNFFTRVTNMQYGLNKFRWTVGKNGCFNSSVVEARNSNVHADAGESRAECADESILIGNKLLSGETGTWTIYAGYGEIENSLANETPVRNLDKGSNVFIWSVASPDGKCSGQAQVEILNNDFTVSVGNPQTVCSSTAFLNGQKPKYGEGVWTVEVGEATFDNSTLPSTVVRNLQQGTNTLRWTARANDCYATDVVTITNLNYPADAGKDQAICNNEFDLVGNSPSPGYGRWEKISGDGILSDKSSQQCRVTNLSSGVNKFSWSVTVQHCTKTDQVKLVNNSIEANAGNGGIICSEETKLNAILPANATGFWTATEGNVSFVRSDANNSIAYCQRGKNVLVWTVNYANCSDSDEIILENKTFDVDAGGYQLVKLSTTTLVASELEAGQTGYWSVISGLGSFDTGSSNVTVVRDLQIGVNEYAWNVESEFCSLKDEVRITFAAFDASAGENINCCGEALLEANETESGQGQWRVIEGSGSFENRNEATTKVTDVGRGENKYEWSISQNGYKTADTIVVYNHSFDVTAGQDMIDCGDAVQLSGTYVESGHVGKWDVVKGNGKFTDETRYNTKVYDYSPGENVFRWTVTNSLYNCKASDEVMLYSKTPPIATFYVNTDRGCSPANILFTNMSEDFVEHQWYFGDGESSVAYNPEHTYTSYDGEKNYDVELVVKGANGCKDTARHTIRIFPEFELDFELEENEIRLPDATVKANVTEGNGLSYYRWNMGNGSTYKNEETIIHTYEYEGEYTIELIAKNESNCARSAEKTVTVYPPLPVANFSMNPSGGCAPLAVQFQNFSEEETSLSWDFGDGTSSTATNPSKLYTSPGEYDVVLTASNPQGDVTLTKTVHVDETPVVDFTFSPDATSERNQAITFTNLSQHALNYKWEFGDNETSTEENPVHYYEKNGVFSIKLIAYTEHGCSRHKNRFNVITISYPTAVTALGKNKMNIYPVPASTELNIQTQRPLQEPASVCLYDLGGKQVLQTEMQRATQHMVIPIGTLKNGAYILRVRNSSAEEQVAIQVVK